MHAHYYSHAGFQFLSKQKKMMEHYYNVQVVMISSSLRGRERSKPRQLAIDLNLFQHLAHLKLSSIRSFFCVCRPSPRLPRLLNYMDPKGSLIYAGT